MDDVKLIAILRATPKMSATMKAASPVAGRLQAPKDGFTPYVGQNKNWWINGFDTGMPSLGEVSPDDISRWNQAYTGTPFEQMTPNATWVIVHNLNKFPAIVTLDSSGREIKGDVTYDTPNQITVKFTAGFSGMAYLN